MSTETDAIDTAVYHGRTQNHKTKIVKIHQETSPKVEQSFPESLASFVEIRCGTSQKLSAGLTCINFDTKCVDLVNRARTDRFIRSTHHEGDDSQRI
jgi:hypothetical protein